MEERRGLTPSPSATDKESMNRSTAALIFAILAAAAAHAQNLAAAFPKTGIASWYGPEFEGKATASGEIFDSSRLTAAHPSLPFGSVLRVTNAHNNRTVEVRVNDRGPFVAARIIDLSRAAAEKLDMIVTGTAPVALELVGASAVPAPGLEPSAPAAAVAEGTTTPVPTAMTPTVTQAAAPAEAAPVVTAPATASPASGRRSAVLLPKVPDGASDKRYRVQVGSYRLVRNATDAFNRLKGAGFTPAYERHGELYRVVLVGVGSAELSGYAERLGGAGFSEALLREEP